MATPKPPARDASPEAVRTYFSAILKELHNLPEADAVSIASHWKYGRGSEISYYDIETYRSIFGPEAGTLLYGHSRQQLRTGRHGPSSQSSGIERSRVDLFGQEPGGGSFLNTHLLTVADISFNEVGLLKLLLILTIGLAVLAFRATDEDKAVWMGAIAVVTGFCFLLGYLGFYFG